MSSEKEQLARQKIIQKKQEQAEPGSQKDVGGGVLSAGDMVALQRMVGNTAVGQLAQNHIQRTAENEAGVNQSAASSFESIAQRQMVRGTDTAVQREEDDDKDDDSLMNADNIDATGSIMEYIGGKESWLGSLGGLLGGATAIWSGRKDTNEAVGNMQKEGISAQNVTKLGSGLAGEYSGTMGDKMGGETVGKVGGVMGGINKFLEGNEVRLKTNKAKGKLDKLAQEKSAAGSVAGYQSNKAGWGSGWWSGISNMLFGAAEAGMGTADLLGYEAGDTAGLGVKLAQNETVQSGLTGAAREILSSITGGYVENNKKHSRRTKKEQAHDRLVTKLQAQRLAREATAPEVKSLCKQLQVLAPEKVTVFQRAWNEAHPQEKVGMKDGKWVVLGGK